MAYLYVMFPDNRIREYRQRAGLSQGQLGDKIGAHQTHVGQMENGKASVTLDWARRIAKVFGIKVADLLSDADNPHRLSEEEQVFVEALRAAPEQDRLAVTKMAEAILPFRHNDESEVA